MYLFVTIIQKHWRNCNRENNKKIQKSTREYKNEWHGKGFALFPFWTKQFGIGVALGIQLLPFGRLLTGCKKEGSGGADEFLLCSVLGSCTFVRIGYNGEYKVI